jgi:hypothetical protein
LRLHLCSSSGQYRRVIHQLHSDYHHVTPMFTALLCSCCLLWVRISYCARQKHAQQKGLG